MSGNIKGIFYGVSTGPGDPELMTVKAVRILKKADSIVAARVMGKQETALEIAKQAVGLDDKEILSLPFSMSGKRKAEKKEHENSIRQIEALLETGKNVAMRYWEMYPSMRHGSIWQKKFRQTAIRQS